MTEDPSSGGTFRKRAEDIFVEHLGRLESGQELDLEALCKQYPDVAEELRELDTGWRRMAGMLQRFGPGGSFEESLHRTYGKEIDPCVTLERRMDSRAPGIRQGTRDPCRSTALAHALGRGRYGAPDLLPQPGQSVPRARNVSKARVRGSAGPGGRSRSSVSSGPD